jgi:hypothetical protein
MPSSHGRQKRAAKQKKRREALRKQRKKGAAAPRSRPQVSPTEVEPLSDELFRALGYDAEREPPEGWDALDEKERLSRVARYHEAALSAEKQPPQPSAHAGLHVIVELQLHSDKPPEARLALQRLRGDGLSRHDAVHAIGWLAADHMRRAMQARTPVDEKAYALDLSQLTRDRWLELAIAAHSK